MKEVCKHFTGNWCERKKPCLIEKHNHYEFLGFVSGWIADCFGTTKDEGYPKKCPDYEPRITRR